MSANLLGTSVEAVFDRVLGEEPSVLFVVNPTGAMLEELVDATKNVESETPDIRILGEEATLKAVMEDFLIASATADLVEADVLTLKTVPENGRSSMCVTEGRVTALIEAGDQVGGLSSDDAEFAETVYEAITAEWEDADSFHLRTPARTRITETLGTDLDSVVREDFEALLSTLESAKNNGADLDEVTISLLVAAKNNVLLYDISKWGEDVGIASKATFSRTKSKLEDKGLIDTEKVPIDVGRPRLRLKIQDERLEDADPAEMADVVRSVLAN